MCAYTYYTDLAISQLSSYKSGKSLVNHCSLIPALCKFPLTDTAYLTEI